MPARSLEAGLGTLIAASLSEGVTFLYVPHSLQQFHCSLTDSQVWSTGVREDVTHTQSRGRARP